MKLLRLLLTAFCVGAAVVAPERRTPASLKKFVSDEIASWAKIIKDSGEE